MSRHKLIKNMDLDDELDDFDGGEDYDYDGEDGYAEELSEEDQENMRVGTIAVRAELSPTAAHITDKQIQEALWNYYYDIEQSVRYLTSTYLSKQKSTKKDNPKLVQKAEGGLISISDAGSADYAGLLAVASKSRSKSCTKPLSFAEFFRDTPWLNVPLERQGSFVAPLLPRGGLLGGSSGGPPKMSKLQALAAARKKKAQEQKSSQGVGVEKPMANLSLSGFNQKSQSEDKSSTEQTLTSKSNTRGFPLRKRKNSDPHEKILAPGTEGEPAPSNYNNDIEEPHLNQATPSAFANTMFRTTPQALPPQHPNNFFSLPYAAAATIATHDPFAGPSPDDVVIAAQSKANGKAGKGPPKTNGEKKADQIANGIEAIKMDDTPRATSKNLDVLAEFEKSKAKNAANFVVIGHVDAGKSTLMGRLLYDLGEVDERTIERYRKEAEKIGKSSFALAWVLDQGTEERNRGVTIDIATNKFETTKTSFTILDAPGHRDFIPNMIAGAAQADFAVLVIDASTGSFESGLKGQTKEHALLVRSMGVQRLIIAINKLDTVNWSEERFDEIKNQVSAFLTAAGFQAKNISFVPCSGLQGDNIARRSTAPAAAWYKGQTIVEELDNSEPVARALTKPLRLTIGDIFRGGVQNPLSISGRIEAGSLQVGDALVALPSNEKCFIKALESNNVPVDWGVAGQNIIVHLSGIEEQHLKIGDVLCSPSSPIRSIREFTAKVLAFEFITPMQIDVHRGRLDAAGKIKEIVAVLDKATGAVMGGKGRGKRPRIVKPGQVARVVVELESAVPLEAPGRVVLRSNGETVAAGLLE